MSRRGWLGFASAILIAHGAVIFIWPFAKMSLVMRSIGRDAGGLHRWFPAPPAAAGTKGVRPSPEMAYAACVYDLAQGDLTIRAQPWAGYMSLSFYSASGGNYAVLNNAGAPSRPLVVTLTSNQSAIGPGIIHARSARGAVLLRRLAPGSSWPRAAALRFGDICAIGPKL